MTKQKSFFALASYITVPSLSIYLLYKAFSIIVEPMDKTTVVRVFILLVSAFVAGWISCYMILKSRIETLAKSPKINLPYSGPKLEPPPEVRTVPFNDMGTTKRLVMDKGSIDLKSAQHNTGVSLKYLIRFANMITPSRANWTGDTVAYTRSKNFFVNAGLLLPDGQGFRWASGVRSENLVSWLEQSYS